MASFHEQADRGRQVDRDCTSRAVLRLWRRNLAELKDVAEVLSVEEIDRLRQLGDTFVAGRDALFSSRIDQGRTVDGHGDLLAADVFCLDDGPRLLDCLEFDDSLRHVDGLMDMASLAVDVERLGRLDLADQLLRSYQVAAGDAWPASLEHFYMAYRALVRAKVACLDAGGGDLESAATAAALLALARDHLRAGTVRLVLVGGLPGTGKSTLATAASHATGWVLLRSDVVRKELAPVELSTPAAGGYGVGLYQPEHTDVVYSEIAAPSRAPAARRTQRASRCQLGATVLATSRPTGRHQNRVRAHRGPVRGPASHGRSPPGQARPPGGRSLRRHSRRRPPHGHPLRGLARVHHRGHRRAGC